MKLAFITGDDLSVLLRARNTSGQAWRLVMLEPGERLVIVAPPDAPNWQTARPLRCPVCGWIHDVGFTQIIPDAGEPIFLRGVLPEIVRLVHAAHERGEPALFVKNQKLIDCVGGYRHPCKAFDDLKHRTDYKRLFDTRRRGFIALRRTIGTNRNSARNDGFSPIP